MKRAPLIFSASYLAAINFKAGAKDILVPERTKTEDVTLTMHRV